jgi:hypothetical protein
MYRSDKKREINKKREVRRIVYVFVYVFFFLLDGRLALLALPPALAGVDDRDIFPALSAFWTSSITRFCSPKHQRPFIRSCPRMPGSPCPGMSSHRSWLESPPAQLLSLSSPVMCYTDAEAPVASGS